MVAAAHDEEVLARAFGEIAVHIERDALVVAVDVGFHADELRVHVVCAGLGERGHGVGREPVPAGDADVRAGIAGNVLAPGEVRDVGLDRAALGVDADLAIAAEGDGADVAGRDAVGFHRLNDGGVELFERCSQGPCGRSCAESSRRCMCSGRRKMPAPLGCV